MLQPWPARRELQPWPAQREAQPPPWRPQRELRPQPCECASKLMALAMHSQSLMEPPMPQNLYNELASNKIPQPGAASMQLLCEAQAVDGEEESSASVASTSSRRRVMAADRSVDGSRAVHWAAAVGASSPLKNHMRWPTNRPHARGCRTAPTDANATRC